MGADHRGRAGTDSDRDRHAYLKRIAARLRGARVERAAERLLRRHGLVREARNWRCAAGELDLIMREGATRVFVEVRYRADESHGGAVGSIDPRKRRRLVLTALAYLRRRGASDSPCRFDVVAASGPPYALELRWIRSAFDAPDLR